jgi:hypothetical protein
MDRLVLDIMLFCVIFSAIISVLTITLLQRGELAQNSRKVSSLVYTNTMLKAIPTPEVLKLLKREGRPGTLLRFQAYLLL